MFYYIMLAPILHFCYVLFVARGWSCYIEKNLIEWKIHVQSVWPVIYVRPSVIKVTYFQLDIRRLTLAAMTVNGFKGRLHVNVWHILGIYDMMVSKSLELFHALKVKWLKIYIFNNMLHNIPLWKKDHWQCDTICNKSFNLCFTAPCYASQ